MTPRSNQEKFEHFGDGATTLGQILATRFRPVGETEQRLLTLDDLYLEVKYKKNDPHIVDCSCDSDFMLEILPKAALSIRRKFNYLSPTTTLYLQLDNAGGHGSDEAKQQYIQILREHHIEVVFQPPRSPECNMLDLGFWMSLQSVVHKTINRSDFTFDADTIWTVCKQQFESFDPQKLINIFNRLKHL